MGALIGRCAALLALLCAQVPAAAAGLADDIAGLRQYSADFTQTLLDARSMVLQNSTGRVRIAPPDRFKWVVNDPYPQTLVTVGESLYVYDPDLEQLTIEPLAAAIAGTPALLLTGQVDDLDSLFDVSSASDPDGRTYALFPKSADAMFAEIRLRFVTPTEAPDAPDAPEPSDRDGAPARLEQLQIFDHLGRQTRITFGGVALNQAIDAAEFEFEIPPGTDVLRTQP
ncbi:MAG: outer membrane lipoprotein chaperone LolA [Pseudomonadota bacterium]